VIPDEILCPDCGEPLRARWYGVLACFCRWGGRQPTVDEIVEAADRAASERRFMKQPTNRPRGPIIERGRFLR
jgi:hypothetical protein